MGTIANINARKHGYMPGSKIVVDHSLTARRYRVSAQAAARAYAVLKRFGWLEGCESGVLRYAVGTDVRVNVRRN